MRKFVGARTGAALLVLTLIAAGIGIAVTAGGGRVAAQEDPSPTLPPATDTPVLPTNSPTNTNTPTMTATPTRTPTRTPGVGGVAHIIQLSSDPDEIVCDGQHPAHITTRLLDTNGVAVPDGTPVYFSGSTGSLSSYVVTTVDGYASTDFYAGYPGYPDYEQADIRVSVARIQAQLTVYCMPPADGCGPAPWPVSPPSMSPPRPTCAPAPCSDGSSPPCPASPPQCDGGPLSPPCATPTPPPCGGDPQSPPCPTATATPAPTQCDGGAFSPPCPTSTVAPCNPANGPCDQGDGFFVALDCDLGTPGIQDNCVLPAGTTQADVGVVIGNNGGLAVSVAAFNFELHDPSTPLLDPPPGVDPNLNANPDFFEADMTGPWVCAPPPDNDTGADGSGAAVSFLSCFNGSGGFPLLGPGGQLTLAIVHYAVPEGPQGAARLHLDQVDVGSNEGDNLVFCYPEQHDVCLPALITVGDVAPGGGIGGPPATSTATPTSTPVPTYTPTATRTSVPTATSTSTPTSTRTATPAPRVCADVTGDHHVDWRDIYAIARHFHRRGANLRYDLNRDGVVDLRDVQIAIRQLGRRCERG